MSNQLVEFAATAQLLDGRLVSLRRLGADDAKAALALHRHLSDYDRYFRFFTLNQIDLDQLVSKMTEPAEWAVCSRRVRCRPADRSGELRVVPTIRKLLKSR